MYIEQFRNLFNKANIYYENGLKIKLMFFENTIFNHFTIIFVSSLILVNFEALFTSSACMVLKALSIPKHSCISRSVFCDAFHLYVSR